MYDIGELSRGEHRHLRQQDQARRFLEQMDGVEIIFQVGLGDWAEGPALCDCFPWAEFYAIEPLKRFHDQARERGFEGQIGLFAAWYKAGQLICLGDRRTKTSAFCQDYRKGSEGVVVVPSITLDCVLESWKIPKKRTLLWMDCEGAELLVLQGGGQFLGQVKYVVCELRDDPPFPGWAEKEEIVSFLSDRDFDYVDHVAKDGLFVRRRDKSQ